MFLDSPTSVREIFLHYGTMYERESWFSSVKSTNDSQQTVFPTINGYTEGNMPDIDVCLNRKVRLYFTSLGGQNDIHTVVLYGHQMEVRSQRYIFVETIYNVHVLESNFCKTTRPSQSESYR